jgi:hypothetical protein
MRFLSLGVRFVGFRVMGKVLYGLSGKGLGAGQRGGERGVEEAVGCSRTRAAAIHLEVCVTGSTSRALYPYSPSCREGQS